MTNQKKITVTIDAFGSPSIEGHNFEGDECVNATKALEETLAEGSGEIERVMKDDDWANTSTGETQEVKQTW